MKTHPTHPNRLRTLAALAVAVISTTAPGFGGKASAQSSYTWTGGGGDNNFGTGANWGGTAPSSLQAYLNFSGNTRTTPNNNYTAYAGGFQIYFNSTATASFTITGNPIKFYNYGGGADSGHPNIQNDSSFLQTVNFTFGSESSGNNFDINANSGNMVFGTTSGNAFSYFDDAGVYLAVHANNGHTVTFNGAIGNGSQPAKFLLDGGGIGVFNAANTYTGESDINAGELQITASGAIASGAAIYLGNGATTAADQITLTGNGGQTFANNFTVNSLLGSTSDHTKRIIAGSNTSGNDTYSGTITLNSDVSMNAENAGGTLTFSGELGVNSFTAYATGPGTVALNGGVDNVNLGLVVNAGTVVLGKTGSGHHAVGTGAAVNSGGMLQLGSGGNGDQIYDGAGVTVNSGGAFDLNGQTETISSLSLNGTGIGGTGALTNSSAAAATLTLTNASTLAGAVTIGGTGNITITGGGNISAASITNLTKIGANTLTLANGSGVDNLNVHLIVNSGTVVLAKTNTSSSPSIHAVGQVVINGGTVQLGGTGGYEIYDGQNSTNLGGVLDLNGQNQTFTGTGSLTINGTGISSGGALINSSATASTVTGTITLGSSSSVGGTGNLVLASALGDGNGGYSLTKVGNGTLTLSAANSYGGGTTLSAGTLAIGNDGALGTGTFTLQNSVGIQSADGTAHTITNALGTLTGSGVNLTFGAVSGGTGALTFANNFNISSGSATRTFTVNNSTTFGGVISGVGGTTLVKAGTGALTLSGANSWGTAGSPGAFTLNAGAVNFNNAAALGNAANIFTIGGGTIDNTAAGAVTTANYPQVWNGDFTFTGTQPLNLGSGAVTLGASRQLNVNASTLTVGGVISGTGFGITKAGGGTLSLAGAETYSGNTTINAGTLALTGSGAVSNSTSISLAAGATLDVSGLASSTFNLSSSTALNASGTGTTVGTSAAAIKGASGGMVNLGSRPITLAYDGSHPALYLSQGNLSLNANAFTVNGAVLSAGTYAIVQQAGGVIASGGGYSVSGTAIGSGKVGSILVSGGTVNLVITENTTTACARTAGSSSSTYGGSLTFTATVTGNGSTPAGNVLFKDGTTTLATVALSGGSAAYATSTLGAGSHAIAAYYPGDANHNSSDSSASPVSQTVNQATPTITTLPAASAIAFGQTLASSTLSGGSASTAGSFVFASPGTTPGVGMASQNIVFTPTDGTDFNTVNASVSVTVNPASPTLALTSSANPAGYLSSLSFTANLSPANATGLVTFFNGATSFSTNSLGSGSASSISLNSLPRGTNSITAIYSGDANYYGCTNSLAQLVTNHPPTAASMTVVRTAGLNLLISWSDVATNWSDVDGDTVTLTGFNPVTTNLVNLTSNSTWIFYTNSPNVADRINYSISDGQGGTNTGYINIVENYSVTGTNSITGIVNHGTSMTVSAFGIPGYNYILERATNLAPPAWVGVITNTAATNGVVNATDSFNDLGSVAPGAAFYRLKWQP